jgi:hypothetical protein
MDVSLHYVSLTESDVSLMMLRKVQSYIDV